MRVPTAIHLLFFAALPAAADPFSLRYDASSEFPENVGWSRFSNDEMGVANRSLDSGVFRLDTTPSISLFDFYGTTRTPRSSGETVEISWRGRVLQTDEVQGATDVAVTITNEEARYAQFFVSPTLIGEDEVLGGDFEHVHSLVPGNFHDFLVVSGDMDSYTLFVDGAVAFSGLFHGFALIGPRHVGFGDSTIGLSSISEWDYVDVRVIPEGQPVVLLILHCCVVRALRRR